jgi:hypothetical protein
MKERSSFCIAIIIYVCILEVFGSNFGRDTGYTEVLHGFTQLFREYISIFFSFAKYSIIRRYTV